MNQVSKPMQIALVAALAFAVLWFVALRPKTEEPVAATPAPAPTTPAVDAGGAAASTGLGKAVESANNAAATSNSANDAATSATGEETPAPGAATTPAPAAAAPAAKAEAKAAAAKKQAKAKKARANARQDRADDLIRSVQGDLKARRAAVVLVYSPTGKEDRVLLKRIKSDIDRRGGRVRPYFVKVSQVGYYDGLLAGLNLSQTPSTIVIAPNNQAKVLGGLVSTERIDRLTSSAILTPVATTP